ncbi:MAG: hypothetical protein EPN88_01635 [Bacteroidetes bacterium]|nr:MAG: hypothetical protein EPN88_01635 [Bacteroidota bacterium]
MESGSLVKKIIYSSAFLAVIPATLFLLLLPPLGSKFKLTIEQTGIYKGQTAYEDLNSDTISEIVFSTKGLPFYYSSKGL